MDVCSSEKIGLGATFEETFKSHWRKRSLEFLFMKKDKRVVWSFIETTQADIKLQLLKIKEVRDLKTCLEYSLKIVHTVFGDPITSAYPQLYSH